ncbi:MAG TPA: hypothetical protein VG454_07090, partial [Gemmatimonadales bacterium]|nr:hypothetical protein [Gemmatimonadales bacterium]
MSLDRLRRNFHTGEFPIASNECLDDEMVAALAEGGTTLDADTRARALRHVAGCALCRRAIASVAEAVADGPVTHEIDVLEGRRRWGGRVTRAGSFLRVTVPLAAAAIIVVLL